jgi:hypothetical protein
MATMLFLASCWAGQLERESKSMDMVASPALLAALLLVVAVIAWSTGRWQANGESGSHALLHRPAPIAEQHHAPPLADTPNAVADQQPLSEADLLALEGDLSLAMLHAEISAFRQRERVFATVVLDDLRLDERPIRIEPSNPTAPARLHVALSPPQGRAA